MKLCYIDAFSGIAGDMTIGALLDAGADFPALNEALVSLGTGASFRFEKTKRKGIAAGKFYVDHTDTKAHRHLHHIEKMITDSGLSDRVKANSIAVFRKLGQSESRMHATTDREGPFSRSGRSGFNRGYRGRVLLPGQSQALKPYIAAPSTWAAVRCGPSMEFCPFRRPRRRIYSVACLFIRGDLRWS
jgi:hypothetical protein